MTKIGVETPQKKRRPRRILIAVLLASLVVVLGATLWIVVTYLDGFTRWKIAELEAAGEGRVVITTDIDWELSKPFNYKIFDADDRVVASGLLGFADPESDAPEFAMHAAVTDPQLIAVVEVHAPSVVLALHDFGTGDSWPAQEDSELFEKVHTRGVRMLQRFAEGIAGATLILSHDAPLQPDQHIVP